MLVIFEADSQFRGRRICWVLVTEIRSKPGRVEVLKRQFEAAFTKAISSRVALIARQKGGHNLDSVRASNRPIFGYELETGVAVTQKHSNLNVIQMNLNVTAEAVHLRQVISGRSRLAW